MYISLLIGTIGTKWGLYCFDPALSKRRQDASDWWRLCRGVKGITMRLKSTWSTYGGTLIETFSDWSNRHFDMRVEMRSWNGIRLLDIDVKEALKRNTRNRLWYLVSQAVADLIAVSQPIAQVWGSFWFCLAHECCSLQMWLYISGGGLSWMTLDKT